MRFVSIAVLVSVLFLSGCPKPNPVDNPPVTVQLTAEENELLVGYRSLHDPLYRNLLVEELGKLKNRDAACERWSWRLRLAGIGLAVLGLLALAVRFVPAVQGWLAAVRIAFPGLPGMAFRVGLYGVAAGGLGLAASFFVPEIYQFLRWCLIGLGLLLGAGLAWEGAALYYTGKIDVPCDGKKPRG